MTGIVIAAALFFPSALFAQTDGSTGLAPSPAETAPLDPSVSSTSTGQTEPAPSGQTTATQQAAPAPAPAPTHALVAVPAPAPTTTQQSAPAAPSPTDAVIAAPVSAPAAEPPSLQDAGAALDAAAEAAPSPLQPYLYAAAGALGAIIVMLGLQEARRRSRKTDVKKCRCCGGAGQEKTAGTCTRCGGKGTVEEEYEPSVECVHCDGEGEEPCEECDGEGKVSSAVCKACEGSGKKRDVDDEPFDCSVCGGAGEASVTVTGDVPCPDCKGPSAS